MVSPPGGGFPSTPSSQWNFNSHTNCQLYPCCGTQLAQAISQISSNPVNFYIRSDNPALEQLGYSFEGEICAVWSGNFNGFGNGCSNVTPYYGPGHMNILDETLGNSQFAGMVYQTSTGSAANANWGMFTAGGSTFVPPNPFYDGSIQRIGQLACKLSGSKCDPFVTNLYFSFNSQFVSGIPSVQQANGGTLFQRFGSKWGCRKLHVVMQPGIR